MLKLFILLWILHFAYGVCPEGFELVRDGECRGMYVTVPVTSMEAPNMTLSKCQEINGKPLIIHDKEHQEYWTNKITGSMTWILLGLVCNSNTNSWQWADGSPLDFKPLSYDAALDKACKQGCSWDLRPSSYDRSWTANCNDHDSTIYKANIYCTTQLEQPVPSANGCDSFEDDSEDGVCYQVGVGSENWQGAQLSCRQLGANLASIHSQQENSFLRRLAVSKGLTSGLYLGASISGKGKEYGWIDGTDWDYQNFRPGFPMNGFGECLSMDTSTTAGLWMNVDCSAELPVACIRDQRPVLEPTCSPGPWSEGELIISPGYPFNASIPCDYFLIVEAGKKVEALISLEANSCCDFLTFYEGDVGGALLANLTGEVRDVVIKTKTSNIMRVDWQPNGAVNVRGFLMSFRGFLH